MKNNIDINEQDIFKYVFSPHLLSEEKRECLVKDERYINQILYYKSIKETVYSKTSNDLQSKIASKIPSYRLANIFFLSPIHYVEEKDSNNSLIFAAKTAEEPKKFRTSSFADKENNYLVKVVRSEKLTKLYLFSFADEKLEEISIKILPEEKEFFMIDNNTPLAIDEKLDVESIELRIG